MGAGYYAVKAAKRVYSDRTIWWRAIVLSALQLIPVAGALMVGGYSLLLMRDAAWGVDRGLPRFSEWREILRRGVDGFIVGFVWSLLPGAAIVLAAVIWSVWEPAASAVPWWATLTISLTVAVLGIVLNVALVRTAVYLRVSAGLSVRGVRQLIEMNRNSFRYVAWLPVALALLGVLLGLPRMLFMRDPGSATAMLGMNELYAFLVGMIQIPLGFIVASAYGLWAGATNPATWAAVQATPMTAAVGMEGSQESGGVS